MNTANGASDKCDKLKSFKYQAIVGEIQKHLDYLSFTSKASEEEITRIKRNRSLTEADKSPTRLKLIEKMITSGSTTDATMSNTVRILFNEVVKYHLVLTIATDNNNNGYRMGIHRLQIS